MIIDNFYDPFKSWYKGGNIWLYSDPHFNDPEMKNLRKNYIGDDEQVKRINSKVGKKDTIIFLGDIGDLSYISKIRGYKILIAGNHDTGLSNFKRLITWKTINDDGTVQIIPEEERQYIKSREEMELLGIKIEDNHLFDEVYSGPVFISDKILLSHEPILNYFCAFNIHGHDHSNSLNDNFHLNLCAELINYTPVALNKIIESGAMRYVKNIHRETIDNAIKKKCK